MSAREAGSEARSLDPSGAWNFRDVAALTGVAPGRLFRSSELSSLDDAGRAALTDQGVTDVADLRTAREVDRHGRSLVPAEVRVHHLPFVETSGGEEPPHEQAFRQAVLEADRTEAGDDDREGLAAVAARHMTEEYRRIATAPHARRAVTEVVTLLASGARVLTHCFAGKDRTGFTTAVVLLAAGVDRDAVVADYLVSNDAVPQLRERVLARLGARARALDPASEGPTAQDMVTLARARLTDSVLGVDEAYLDAALRTIDALDGSPAAWLRAGGVSEETLREMRAALLG